MVLQRRTKYYCMCAFTQNIVLRPKLYNDVRLTERERERDVFRRISTKCISMLEQHNLIAVQRVRPYAYAACAQRMNNDPTDLDLMARARANPQTRAADNNTPCKSSCKILSCWKLSYGQQWKIEITKRRSTIITAAAAAAAAVIDSVMEWNCKRAHCRYSFIAAESLVVCLSLI